MRIKGCKFNGKICPNCGKVHSDQTGIDNPMNDLKARKKSSISHKGKHYSPETEFKKGEHRSPETEFKKGEHRSPETEFKKGQGLGKNNVNWRGGVSFEVYPKIFNNELKELIRKRDNYICQECGVHQNLLKEKLSIHHIDYNKKNNHPNNLIALCRHHHIKTLFRRKYWKEYFQRKMKLKRENIKNSFTAASVFPTKLIHTKVIKNNKFFPIHIQIVPTNVCNLNCEFCCCKDVDKKKFLTFEQVKYIIDIGAKYGTKTITWTGGGETFLHPKFNQMIRYAQTKGIKCGLVTNGTLLKKLDYHPNLVWIRISNSDDRSQNYEIIKSAIEKNSHVDFSFSYVVTRKINYKNIKELIRFANENKFTHMRLTTDLTDLDSVKSMKKIRKKMGRIDDSKVIYQERKESSTYGTKKCFMSLIKPYIAPEGIFGCCGTQYSDSSNETNKMSDKMRMGRVEDFERIITNQQYFNGSVCDVCYYSQYNNFLAKLKEKIVHKEFV